jgi:hypothetical protein
VYWVDIVGDIEEIIVVIINQTILIVVVLIRPGAISWIVPPGWVTDLVHDGELLRKGKGGRNAIEAMQ